VLAVTALSCAGWKPDILAEERVWNWWRRTPQWGCGISAPLCQSVYAHRNPRAIEAPFRPTT
jgi:hypothetical protein